jgi:tartrate dehydrogenase/decarboxylase/D-malate dehydrogenase
MRQLSLGLIPGDGIGIEVMKAARRVLEAQARGAGDLTIAFTEYPWGVGYYREHGRMMPEDGLEQLRRHDALLLGAVGYPGVPDHVSLWGLLLPIRREFDLAVNLRPVRLRPGLPSPLRDFPPRTVDLVIVRENTEGEYSPVGGRIGVGTPFEQALSTAVFSRRACERTIRYAARLARRRRRKLIGATKSNGLPHTMPFWDEIFRAVTAEFPDVEASLMHADALAAYLVLHPDACDVIVGSNLLADILSDLAGALVGSIGVLASANLGFDGRFPSLFEPVHGSAPDIAGRGIANPIGMLASVVLMWEHLGHEDLAHALDTAIDEVLAAGVRTPDLGGHAGTDDVVAAVMAAL